MSQVTVAPESPSVWTDVTQLKSMGLSTRCIQAAPTPMGCSGSRVNFERWSPHLNSAKPAGGTYFTRFGSSSARTDMAAQIRNGASTRNIDTVMVFMACRF